MTYIHNQTIQSPINTSSPAVLQPKVSLGESFKPKRAGKTKSHIVFVLDDSGSMQSCREATITGFNEYLQAQQIDAEKTGIETFVSLFKFNGRDVTGVINRVAIKEVEPLTLVSYNPLGSTNLLDAMGAVMMSVNQQLSENKKANRESVIITVLTDGAENASRTFVNNDIKQMVEKAEAKSWGFMFLGANIDAFAASSQLGFSRANTIQYDVNQMGATISAASSMTSRMRSAYAQGLSTSGALYDEVGFTDQERAQAVSKE